MQDKIERIQDREEAGQDGHWTGQRQDRKEAGQDGQARQHRGRKCRIGMEQGWNDA